jgi:hypothetical protein
MLSYQVKKKKGNRTSMFFARVNLVNIKNSGLVLVAASLPGAQKLLIISTIMQLHGAAAAGQFAALTALPIFISLLTGAGFGGKLLKLIPGEKISKQKQSFSDIAVASFLYMAIVCAILIFLNLVGIVDKALLITLYLLSVSFVQLIRHYYLATLNYLYLLAFDIVQLLLIFLPIFFVSDVDKYLLISSIAILFFCIVWYVYVISIFKSVNYFFYDKESLQLSANNILSGGVLALLPLMLERFYSKAVVGEVFVIISFFSLFLLCSRAFASFKIPILVKLLKLNRSEFYSAVKDFHKQYTLLTAVCLIISLIVAWWLIHFKITNIINISLIATFDFISIILFIFSGSFGVAQAITLFVLGKQKYNLYSNILFFIIYFIALGVVSLYWQTSLSQFFILSSIISFARLPYLYFHARKAVNKICI